MDKPTTATAIEGVELPRQGTSGGYTPEKRMQVALAWVVSGTNAEASRITGVPETTISGWTRQPWWESLVAEARRLKDAELDRKLSQVIDKAMERLVERLDKNESINNIKDLAVVAAVAYDKRALMRGDPTSRVEKVSVEQRLNRLTERFREVAAAAQAQSDGQFMSQNPHQSTVSH